MIKDKLEEIKEEELYFKKPESSSSEEAEEHKDRIDQLIDGMVVLNDKIQNLQDNNNPDKTKKKQYQRFFLPINLNITEKKVSRESQRHNPSPKNPIIYSEIFSSSASP